MRLFLSSMALLVGLHSTAVQALSPLVVDDASIHTTDEYEWVPAIDTLRAGSTDTKTLTVSLANGLRPGVEWSVRAGYGWYRDEAPATKRSGEGLVDVNLGLKSPLWSASSLPFRFSASGTVKVPAASVRSGLGTGTTDFTGLAIGTYALGNTLLDLNAGRTWTAVDQRSRRNGDGWFAGGALRARVTEPLLLFAESYATKPVTGTGSAVTLRLGLQVQFVQGMSVNLAIGRGRNQGVTESQGMLGLTIVR